MSDVEKRGPSPAPQEPLREPAPQSPQPQDQGEAPAQKHSNSQRPLTPGQQRRRKQSVFQYIAILFAAAFVLLLFTFLMERRQNDLLQQQSQEQIDELQQSVSATQTLENMYNENLELKDKVEELEGQLADAQSQAGALSQTAADLEHTLDCTKQAMDWFWQIDEAYVRSRWTLCRQFMDSLEEAGLEEFLPKESVTDNGRFSPYDRYLEIKEAVE